jgi:adenine-specific DNA-methyltransferase
MSEENKIKVLEAKVISLEAKIKELKDHKNYGLIWEPKIEKFDKESKDALPVLKEKGGKFKDIVTNKDNHFNILIEGDNYHALSVLSYTHRNKIDLIYIDPPYNTGNKDFIYNDHYVDREDRFRHSKWLSFMEKRLKLAKGLLKNTGSIFISIDDNEFAQLKMLCDKIFGQDNFESFIWKKKGGSGNTEKILGNLTEYILCYFKKKKPGVLNYRNIERNYKYSDDKGPYNLAGIEKTNMGSYERLTMRFAFIDPKTKKKFFPSENMRWTIGELNAKKAIEENKIFFDYKKGKVFLIRRPEDDEESENVFYNLLTDFGSLSTAKDELYRLFGNREIFDTPKPIELIIHLIEIASKNDATILDFFAGSGTTGQAVLSLNKIIKDSNRKFILCTNNENNICENITYERIKKVILGYKDKENNKIGGFSGNLKYLKADFIKLEKSIDTLKSRIVEGSTEIICLKDNSFDLVLDNYSKNRIKIFQNKDKYTAILFDLFYFDDFVNELKKLNNKPVSVYIFSYAKDFSKEEFGDLGIKFTIEPIPENILETYKKIFNF